MLHIPGFPKFCSSRNLTAVKEMDKWKATPRDNVLLMISNGAPIQDGCPTEKKKKLKLLHAAWQWSYYSLLFPCSISFAESFVTCLRNKAYVYLLKKRNMSMIRSHSAFTVASPPNSMPEAWSPALLDESKCTTRREYRRHLIITSASVCIA